MERLRASIDVGSNTCLMLLARRTSAGGWERVLDRAIVTRISEGLDRTGHLEAEPIARTAVVLAEFASEARELSAEILLTGTAPFRRAANGARVAQLLSEKVGVTMRVVSGEEEAELVRIATRVAFPDLRPLVVMDPGGASTEVVVDSGVGPPSTWSFDVGSVRLYERFSGEADGYGACRAFLDAELKPALSSSAGVTDSIVGIAGTVTSLAMFDLGLVSWDHERVHGHRISAARVSALHDLLFGMTVSERRAHPSIDTARADVLPWGVGIVLAVMRGLDVDELRVSDYGLRWGRLAANG